MKLSFHPAALAELSDAVAYLEDERPGFGEAFLEEVGKRVVQAARLPESGAPVQELARHDVRQHLIRRFHYALVTARLGDARVVVAVAHTSRAPGYWAERLSERL